MLIVILIALLALPTAYGGNSAPIKLTKPVNISRNASTSLAQDVLALDKFVYVAWLEVNDTTGLVDIYFKTSHNHGKSFGQAVKLSSGEGFNFCPKIAGFGDNVYIIWLHEGEGDFGAKFRASHDNGKHFDQQINFGSDTWYARADIAAYDDNVYLAFEHPAIPGTEAIFQASHDAGVTFGDPFIYRKGPCVGGETHVAAWKNDVYVTALDPCEDHSSLEFRASHNYGETFSRPIYIGADEIDDENQQVSIVAKDKFVYGLIVSGS